MGGEPIFYHAQAAWTVHRRWQAAKSINFILKFYLYLNIRKSDFCDVLSKYVLIMELRLDAGCDVLLWLGKVKTPLTNYNYFQQFFPHCFQDFILSCRRIPGLTNSKLILATFPRLLIRTKFFRICHDRENPEEDWKPVSKCDFTAKPTELRYVSCCQTHYMYRTMKGEAPKRSFVVSLLPSSAVTFAVERFWLSVRGATNGAEPKGSWWEECGSADVLTVASNGIDPNRSACPACGAWALVAPAWRGLIRFVGNDSLAERASFRETPLILKNTANFIRPEVLAFAVKNKLNQTENIVVFTLGFRKPYALQ